MFVIKNLQKIPEIFIRGQDFDIIKETINKINQEKDIYRYELDEGIADYIVHRFIDKKSIYGHENLVFYFLVREGKPITFHVSKRDGFEGENTYNDYIFIAEKILKDLNKLANFSYRIQSSKQLEKKFTGKPASALLSFVQLANKQALHPYDWDRFYTFIRRCHTYRTNLTETDLAQILIENNFPQEVSDNLSNIYQHGRKILSIRSGYDYQIIT